MGTEIKLELDGVSKRFKDKTVLKGFSLALKEAELCCLLGPSGCGKSTTLKIIAGFLNPDDGGVRLSGREITYCSPQERNVGLVFQNYALFPHLNVFDNVAYGLRRRKRKKPEIRREVEEMLALVQLEGYEYRYIHELSGGQQQRVALARSLVTSPDLLLLDEPLSNLDAKLRVRMRNEIVRIQKRLKLTTIYVTHDQEEAMSIADLVVVMNNGIIEQTGSPREIYEQPISLFVADFIGRVNLLHLQAAGSHIEVFSRFLKLPDGFSVNSEIICVIRPETVILTHADASPIQAVIKKTTYLGPLVHYILDFSNPVPELLVEISTPDAVYKTGQKVGIRIEDKDIQFFK